MKQPLPSADRLPAAASSGGFAGSPPGNSVSGAEAANHGRKRLRDLLEADAVVVIARDGCCMCHVIKLLLLGHGVSPTIRLVCDGNEAAVKRRLSRFLRRRGGGALPQFPVVFVGGELFGGLDEIMRAHISGELLPKFRAAGAL